MKIALLTNSHTVVVDHLESLLRPDDFVVVDFSRDYALSGLCRNKHIRHMRFSSWECIKEKMHDFDMLVSYKLHKIIPMDIVRLFKFGGVNIHPSLLPRYSGANPWFQMYCNMDLNAGVTIHKIAENPDSGNILIQQSFRITLGQPLPSVMQTADNLAACLITEVIVNGLYIDVGVEQPLTISQPNDFVDFNALRLLPVERLWHLLRGFPSLISVLYPDLPAKHYEVGGYSRQVLAVPVSGNIDLGKSPKCIVCHDGIIHLKE